MSKKKEKATMVSLKKSQVTPKVSQNEKINSDTGNVQFISEGIGLEDFVTIEGKNSNNVVKGEENEMNKTQEVKRNHAEIVVDATQQGEQAKVASAVKKVEAKKESKAETAAPTTEQLVSMINNLKEELKQAKEDKEEIIPAKVEGGKQEMYKQQTAAMNSAEVATGGNTETNVVLSQEKLNALIREAVENAQKANANLPAPQVEIKEEVKEEKKAEVVENKESKEEEKSEENDYSFFFGAAVGAAAVYGGQKLYEYLNDDSADDASEAFSLISDMF